MEQLKSLRLFPMKTLTVALMGALVVFGAACAGEEEVTPTPTPAATPISTPTPAVTPADHVAEGRELYLSKGCAFCHGQDAEGTDVAPALPGHNEEQVLRQVRRPVGNMPSFTSEQISDDELEMIADYIESLESMGGHREPISMEDALVVHHWMALYALEADSVAEAEHHVRHIVELVTDAEHKAQMENVLEHLQAGDLHDASHVVGEMLAGTAEPDLTLENLHLELILSALEAGVLEDAKHHLQHFIDLATGDEKNQAEEAMELLEQDNIPDGKHEVEELLEQAEAHGH